MPCNRTIFLSYSGTHISISQIAWIGIKWANLVSLFTTTQTMYFSWVEMGNPIVKSLKLNSASRYEFFSRSQCAYRVLMFNLHLLTHQPFVYISCNIALHDTPLKITSDAYICLLLSSFPSLVCISMVLVYNTAFRSIFKQFSSLQLSSQSIYSKKRGVHS